ncbi:von Willebrand factor [Trypanosoma melophagium]|uniref:von Willebrand factor n=1 Tax=Trypanosoma melophagium TaxID=715481 RepID=UPI00351A4A39|nr:von Willebrand factor [Trypanosoma melophagium]
MSLQHFAYSSAPDGDIGVLTASAYTALTLRGCAVEVEVRGNCARVNVRYEYMNYTGKEHRVIAVYPLPSDWDLLACRAEHNADSVFTNTIETQRNPISINIHTNTNVKGDLAVAAQALPWVVATGGSVIIAATYHVPLDTTRSRRNVRVQLPAELFPRVQKLPSSTLAYASLFDMKVPSKIPEGWTIDAKCDMFVPLAGAVQVYPASAQATTQVEYIGDSGFTLHYNTPITTSQMRDGFEVNCEVRQTAEPMRFFIAKDVGVMVKDEDHYALTLAFTPQLEERSGCIVNTELVLVVDSHNREVSAAIAQSIAIAVRGVPDTVRVNVVLVGTKNDVSLCPRGAMSLTELPLDQIMAFVNEAMPQPAGTGGSKLHRALRAVMKQDTLSLCGPVSAGYVRHVVVMSDEGETPFATEIIAEAVHHRPNMCFSAIGVLLAGKAEVSMLRLLAEEGGGVYRDAVDAQGVSEVLVEILAKVMVPALTNIVIRFDEPEVRASVGTTLPAVAQGTERFVYGIAPASLTTLGITLMGRIGPMVIEYVGKGNPQEVAFTSATESQNPLSVGLFHLAAASARIRYLIENSEHSGLSKVEIQEVARLSKTFMLPSPFTEMIQIRPSAPPTSSTTTPVLIAVNYMPRSGKYMRRMMRYKREQLANGSVDRRPRAKPLLPKQGEEQKEKEAEEIQETPIMSSEGETTQESVVDYPQLVPPSTTREFIRAIVVDIVESVVSPPSLKRLTALQAADGSFPLNATLGTAIGITLERLEKEVPLDGFGVSEDMTAARDYLKVHERVWATVVAAAAMELRSLAITTLAYKKALAYAAKHDTEGELLRRARNLIAKSPSVSL